MISQEVILNQLKAQPKKTAVMCLLIVVLVVVVLRAFNGNGPQAASAMVNSLLPPGTGAQAAENRPSEPIGNPETINGYSEDPTLEKGATAGALPQRNIFAVNLNYYPQPSGTNGSSLERNQEADPRQLQTKALRDQLQGFHLQSTMTGPDPTAYIDGNLIREGETYKGFTLRHIQDGKIILEAKGYLFSLILDEK